MKEISYVLQKTEKNYILFRKELDIENKSFDLIKEDEADTLNELRDKYPNVNDFLLS
jgi:hypothetical protein